MGRQHYGALPNRISGQRWLVREHCVRTTRIHFMKQILAMIIAAVVLAGCGGGNAIESAGSNWSKDMWRDNDRSAPGGG
jgi:hypothetical protein